MGFFGLVTTWILQIPLSKMCPLVPHHQCFHRLQPTCDRRCLISATQSFPCPLKLTCLACCQKSMHYSSNHPITRQSSVCAFGATLNAPPMLSESSPHVQGESDICAIAIIFLQHETVTDGDAFNVWCNDQFLGNREWSSRHFFCGRHKVFFGQPIVRVKLNLFAMMIPSKTQIAQCMAIR